MPHATPSLHIKEACHAIMEVLSYLSAAKDGTIAATERLLIDRLVTSVDVLRKEASTVAEALIRDGH